MTPRQVIADAVCLSFYDQPMAYVSEFRRAICHKMADAVIDALEKMTVTDAMRRAWMDAWKADRPDKLDGGQASCEMDWRAMVGAMRSDE